MARTAVIAGTASAVAGGVQQRQQAKAQAGQQQQAAQQAAFESQAQMAEMQAQLDAVTQQQTPAPAPAAGDDLMGQLQRLSDLHAAGVLSDEEFAAAKAKLLA
jgi:multidrug resistance efflux pump